MASELDKFLAHYYKARVWVEKNKKSVYVALTVLVVIVAGIVIYINNKNANNEKAAVEFSKIKALFDEGKYQQAINGDSTGTIKGLQSIVDNYGSTENGEISKYYLATSYYYTRDFEKAEKYYKDYSGSNLVLKLSSKAGLASVMEARNSFADAAKLFENVARENKEDNPYTDEYLFYAGRNYFMAGDKENAKRIFTELKTEFPKSPFNSQAQRYTFDLNM